jgi:hypothetical protein
MLPLTTTSLRAQENVGERLDRIERENRELRERLDRLAPQDPSMPGGAGSLTPMPPGYRKVYASDEGVSIAGYGEFLYQQRSGRNDVADALRAVLYFGYHFDEKWIFHSEIEFEHGSTSAESGSTDEPGEVSVEFGYLEYRANENLALRGGLVLVPVGLVNEQHEPTLFMTSQRSQTETRIIPTTWRQMGFEAVATQGDFDVRFFVGTGLDGEEFGASGYRDGRQNGNREIAEDVATALRVDWRCCPTFTVGSSVYYQKAGQDGVSGATPIPEMDTLIAEAHADWRCGGWIARALYASGFNDDALEFATATGDNLAERLYGYYGEVGYDVSNVLFRDSDVAVIPFVRYEHIDTQADMPQGILADPDQDNRIVTVGLDVKPNDQIVFKLDFADWSDSYDRMTFAMGYVF